MGGLVAGGCLSLAVGTERLVNAMLIESGADVSTRMVIAAVGIAAASVFFALAVVEREKLRRRSRGPRPPRVRRR